MQQITPVLGSILALDPGVTTGAALWTTEASLYPWQIHDDWTPHKKLWNELTYYRPEVIVYESFNYQRRDKVVLFPVEIIGVINTWQQIVSPETVLAVQSPSYAKTFWTDDKLKQLNVYQTNLRHGNDAIRHLLAYMTNKGDKRWVKRLRPS